jgi:hypothetical protein
MRRNHNLSLFRATSGLAKAERVTHAAPDDIRFPCRVNEGDMIYARISVGALYLCGEKLLASLALLFRFHQTITPLSLWGEEDSPQRRSGLTEGKRW